MVHSIAIELLLDSSYSNKCRRGTLALTLLILLRHTTRLWQLDSANPFFLFRGANAYFFLLSHQPQVWHLDSADAAAGLPELPPLVLQHSSFVYAVAVHPAAAGADKASAGSVAAGREAHPVLTADYDGCLRLWDAYTGQLLYAMHKVRPTLLVAGFSSHSVGLKLGGAPVGWLQWATAVRNAQGAPCNNR